MVGVLSIEQAGTIVRAGLLLLLFLAGNVLGLRWRHYAFGIALGFALHASVELVAIAVRARLGTVTPIWPLVDGIAYHCSLLIWIVYLFSRERVRPRLGLNIRCMSWNGGTNPFGALSADDSIIHSDSLRHRGTASWVESGQGSGSAARRPGGIDAANPSRGSAGVSYAS